MTIAFQIVYSPKLIAISPRSERHMVQRNACRAIVTNEGMLRVQRGRDGTGLWQGNGPNYRIIG